MTSAAGLQLLRPALELTWAVARVGEQQNPRVLAPRSLRPFLRFAKLPDRALDAVGRALDEDEDFRARVSLGADQEAVGRAGHLFIVRPDGWEEELAALIGEAEQVESQENEEQAERSARKRLAATEEARRKAEDALTVATADVARLSAEAAEERRRRQQTDQQLATATADVDRMRAEAGSFRSSAERARNERDAVAAELERLHSQLAAVNDEVATLGAAPAVSVTPPAPVIEPDAAPPPAPIPVEPVIDRAVLADALRDAAAAFTQLGQSLRRAAGAVHEADRSETEQDDDIDDGPERETRSESETIGATADLSSVPNVHRRRPDVRRRTAAPLPPAVFDDSPEAAEHLVRLNGVLVLVDGYNVSKLRWPELVIPEQRRRLVHTLAGLAARTGADVHVVFDGVDQVEPPLPPERRRLVRVSFSPQDVEADDVLIALVDDVPLHRPVVVVSSDRRVQNEAAQAGANVVSSGQLLQIL